MSAQLLICKFAVFTCFRFISAEGMRDWHGLLARSLSRPMQYFTILFLFNVWKGYSDGSHQEIE